MNTPLIALRLYHNGEWVMSINLARIQGKHYPPQRRSTLARNDGNSALAVVTSHHLFRQKGAYHPSVCMGLNS